MEKTPFVIIELLGKLFITPGDLIGPQKIIFFKGTFSHSLFLTDEAIFIDKLEESSCDYKVIFNAMIPNIIRTKEERVKDWFKHNHLSILLTKNKDEPPELINT